MCGICGFFKINKYAPDMQMETLQLMNNEMVLRGPNGGNIWVNKNFTCGLGHRRLSIIDLTAVANQPMSNEDNTIQIVFNGEIYNHAEIRKELEQYGHKWKTNHSDTEVIIHAYEQWGIDCLAKFRGMFAFALLDEREGKLYLVRDRFGIKPLYYMVEDGKLLFASEIKALMVASRKSPSINERAMYDYLSFLCTPGEESMYEGVNKLRPGTYFCIKQGEEVKKVNYYDVWDHYHPEMADATPEEIQRELLDELRVSIRYRKVSDVPVGIFLSGGIDSSLNCALFSEEQRKVVKAFCIGYEGDNSSYHNENEYARLVAEKCGADFHEKLLCEEDLLTFIPKMIYLQDEPIADSTCVPAYYVAELARKNGVIVAQVGEGSDELFCGYRRWLAYLKLSLINRKVKAKLLKKGLYTALTHIGHKSKAYTELLRRANCNLPIFWSGAEAFYEYDKEHMISEAFARRLDGYSSFEAIRGTYERFLESAWEKSDLNWMTYADLRHRLPELLLMRVDKMSMGVSLESRVPYLDHVFVEKALSIPSSMKYEGNVSKAVLKKAVRGLIPDEIIDRKKQGFGIPLQDWLFKKAGQEMTDTINKFVANTGYFDEKYIVKIMARSNAKEIWYLYNLSKWWEINIA